MQKHLQRKKEDENTKTRETRDFDRFRQSFFFLFETTFIIAVALFLAVLIVKDSSIVVENSLFDILLHSLAVQATIA